MIVSGLFLFFSSANLIHKIANLLPGCVSTYLLSVFNWAVHLWTVRRIGYRKDGRTADCPVFLGWFSYLYLSRHSIYCQYSILISLGLGWFFFYVFGLMQPQSKRLLNLFSCQFFLRTPVFDAGMISPLCLSLYCFWPIWSPVFSLSAKQWMMIRTCAKEDGPFLKERGLLPGSIRCLADCLPLSDLYRFPARPVSLRQRKISTFPLFCSVLYSWLLPVCHLMWWRSFLRCRFRLAIPWCLSSSRT